MRSLTAHPPAGAAEPIGFPEGLDTRHVPRYSRSVIRSFADSQAEVLYVTGRSRRLPPEIAKRAVRRLEQLNAATGLADLKVPPSNRLHELERERQGQYSIAVNDQWRICFRFEDGDAFDVEVCDYH